MPAGVVTSGTELVTVLRIRQGKTVRRTLRISNPDGTYVTLTGTTFESGWQNRLSGAVVKTVTVTLTDATTALLLLTDETNDLPTGTEHLLWYCNWTDGLGQEWPVFTQRCTVVGPVGAP